MKDRERYIGSKEIMFILGVGYTRANEILHMFEYRGQMYRIGRSMKVKEKVFNDWLQYECKQEGIHFRRAI